MAAIEPEYRTFTTRSLFSWRNAASAHFSATPDAGLSVTSRPSNVERRRQWSAFSDASLSGGRLKRYVRPLP